MTASDTGNATKCPLCGHDNQCAMAAGNDPETCWCMSVTIAPETLASIPAEAQGKFCVCAKCATGGSGGQS